MLMYMLNNIPNKIIFVMPCVGQISSPNVITRKILATKIEIKVIEE